MESLVMAEQFKSTYQNKKVFLTGHTGFKGAWMLVLLHLLGAKIKGYALGPEKKSLYNLIKGDGLCNSVISDVRDKEKLQKEIAVFEPDFVFHFAAQSLVRESYRTPVETYETNVIGTANLLNALRDLQKPCNVIAVTTDKVYENKEWIYPYRENDPLGGYDPYSSSKACAEIACASFRSSFFNTADYDRHLKSIATARAGNVIGGGDWAKDRIIPDLIRAMENNEPLEVRNPSAVRPWQHVLEPLSGYLLIGQKMTEDPIQFAQAYNFGPYNDDVLTVKELVKIALSRWGQGDYRIDKTQATVHEANLLKLDITKAITELGWKPKLIATQSIENTIDWYKHYNNRPLEYTIEQIKDYFGEKLPV